MKSGMDESYSDSGAGAARRSVRDIEIEGIDRRIEQMRLEGVEFVVNAHVGKTVPTGDLRRDFDAILLAGGAEQPRDLNVPGRELKGIHFAMEFLPQQNRRVSGENATSAEPNWRWSSRIR